MNREEQKQLKKRYLIWLYKTLKELIDRIERKFTQLEIDRFILGELEDADTAKEFGKLIKQWDEYIHKKEQDGNDLKYSSGNKVRLEYRFLELKFRAVEKAIVEMYGAKALKEIRDMYEREMVDRILMSKEERI
ncbi:MAG: hypothetical protein MJA29_01300 [Candidatus Omnitrophica bacterium]|nr:hypothetical protein [Candidatus Omnitrophota bacterium]